MTDKGWIEVQAQLQAYLELALVILWEEICSRKFLISAKETRLQSNTTGNVNYLSNIVCKRVGSLVWVGEKFWRPRRHFSSRRGGSAAKIFPELAQVSLLAGYLPQDEIHVCTM